MKWYVVMVMMTSAESITSVVGVVCSSWTVCFLQRSATSSTLSAILLSCKRECW